MICTLIKILLNMAERERHLFLMGVKKKRFSSQYKINKPISGSVLSQMLQLNHSPPPTSMCFLMEIKTYSAGV